MKKTGDILFLCQYFYPEYVSSAVLPFETAEELARAGYLVGALCGYPKEYNIKNHVPPKETYRGVQIIRLKYLQIRRDFFGGRAVNSLSFFVSVLLHLRVLGKYKKVIVYSNPPFLPLIAALAKKIFHTKIIFVSYDVYPEIGIVSGKIKVNGTIDKLFRLMNTLIFKTVDHVVALSGDMEKYLCKNRKLEAGKLSVIPNWAEKMEVVKNTEVQNPRFSGIPKDAFVVSYLGNMGVCQEEHTLLDTIRSLKNHPAIHFLIAGHGTKMQQLFDIVKHENLSHVHFYDFLKGDDYTDALRISNLFIVTLIKGMEGLCSPSKASSYLMAGKPIIIVADKGLELAEDILKNKCGYFVEQGDSLYMQKCILEQAQNRQLNVQMGNNSLALFNLKYEKDVCLRQYITLLEKRIG